ncbi:Do family serine endopeptidase [Fodinibius sp.]|uniref:Do family serine endopeptidase n=1 Tax=Fodinibius sp. TaxID=1872440 RepID=UPI002ACD546B|nr:Do family serine endopeptidase [Fodinibius sp.]MDZ7658323.1 Do family serine endopeptidase [Fodinibius sp.]
MEKIRSSNLLWAFVAVLVVGFYTVDLQTNNASVLSLPGFSSDEKVEQSEKPPSKTIGELNDAIVDIADKTKQAVVTVKVTQTVEARPNPLSQFFGNPRQQPQEYQRRGQGSGVIVSDKGYILTNNHVVENASEVEVQLLNDKRYDAKVIGTDPLTDIAVLKIDAQELNDLNVVKLGNSEKLRVGEMVLAIGSPLQASLAHSVSMGIVSAKGRSIGIIEQGAGYENFIQTDAAINPGNSGGALVDMDGELIGINTAIASRSGGSDGIGFAVPIDIAKNVMKSIIENGSVVRGYLGIQMGGEVDATMAKALGLDEAYGIIVGSVPEDGPAAEAGLQADDIIQTINGEPVRSWGSLRTSIGTSPPGTEVELGIIRDGDKQTITVTLGQQPEDMMTAMQPGNSSEPDIEKKLGFKVEELTPRIAQELELSENQDGVVVTQISRQSEAYQQGLRRGFVITEVDRQEISNVREFNRAMSQLVEGGKDVALLRVTTPGGNSQLVAFEL